MGQFEGRKEINARINEINARLTTLYNHYLDSKLGDQFTQDLAQEVNQTQGILNALTNNDSLDEHLALNPITLIKSTFNDCLEILEKKNNDYASVGNFWANFEASEDLNVPAALAIFIRFRDKVSRIKNLLFIGKDRYVTDESIDDTINDAINYLALLKARRAYDVYKSKTTTAGYPKNAKVNN